MGTGTIRMDQHNGYHILEMTARSARLFDLFFKVRDYFKSVVRPGFTSFQYYEKKIHEGKYRRHDQVWYDLDQHKITYKKNGELGSPHYAVPPIFDPLSALHAYRFLCPKEGNCTLQATDGKRIDELTVIRLGEEQLNVGGRQYEAIKVMPVWQRMQGVFRKKKGGHVYVWFEKYPPFRPLKMEADIFIGKVVAKLVDAKGAS